MSEKSLTIKEEREEERKRRREWWNSSTGKRRQMYRLLRDGKSIKGISKVAGITIDAVERFVTHRYVLKKLEVHLSRILFDFQINSVLGMSEALRLFRSIMTGKRKADGISRVQASKFFLQLLTLLGKEPKIVNPQQYNIIIGIAKKALPKSAGDLEKEFGFEGLRIHEGSRESKEKVLDMQETSPSKKVREENKE